MTVSLRSSQIQCRRMFVIHKEFFCPCLPVDYTGPHSPGDSMFDLLPDKTDMMASRGSPVTLLIAIILSAVGGGLMLGIFLGRHFGDPMAAVEGVGFVLIAVWYSRILLRAVGMNKHSR